MKIRKYAGGGYNYIPISYNTEAGVKAPASSNTSSSSDDDKVPGFAKEVIKLSQVDGFRNDINAYYDLVGKVMDLANDPSGANLSMREVMNVQRATQIYKNISEGKKRAEDQLTAQDAWQDLAVASGGLLYVEDAKKGTLMKVRAQDIAAEPEKYRLITNSRLLEHRNVDPELSNNQGIVQDLIGTIGMSTVNKTLLDVIRKFGTMETASFTKKDQAVANGLEKILGNGPDGYYKLTQKEQLENKDVNAALDYLYNMLPESYKNTLRANAIASGMPSDKALILNMLQRHLDFSIDASYQKEMTTSAGKGSKSGSGDSSATVGQSLGEAYQTGSGFGPMHTSRLQTSKQGIKMEVQTQDEGQILTKDGGVLGDTSLQEVITKGKEFGGALDLTGVTFGDVQLNGMEDFSKIAINSAEGLKRVYMPTMVGGDGRSRVAFDLFDKLESVNQQVTKGMTEGQINGLIEEAGLSAYMYYDSKEKKVVFNPAIMKPYMALAGTVADTAIDGDFKHAKWVKETARRSDDRTVGKYYNDIVTNAESPAKVDKAKIWRSDFFTGMVYIPLLTGPQSLPLYNHQLYSKADYMETDASYAYHQAEVAQQDNLKAQVASGNLRLTL